MHITFVLPVILNRIIFAVSMLNEIKIDELGC